LKREFYQADAVIFWTMPVSCRQQGWLTNRFHAAFREMVLHAAVREGLICPAYCLMLTTSILSGWGCAVTPTSATA